MASPAEFFAAGFILGGLVGLMLAQWTLARRFKRAATATLDAADEWRKAHEAFAQSKIVADHSVAMFERAKFLLNQMGGEMPMQ